ncbi:hypothetical protein HAZT_HAZT000485 [Hyalella azteca]|uniref:Uncharacterized protein n=1 Tax=Hyalella azteca TaxID=294128 RepID=A0A6A0GTM0_HYAAZ|nr:hypothetical protein HAZT_HAZT000485 [Hyalella azteca]
MRDVTDKGMSDEWLNEHRSSAILQPRTLQWQRRHDDETTCYCSGETLPRVLATCVSVTCACVCVCAVCVCVC